MWNAWPRGQSQRLSPRASPGGGKARAPPFFPGSVSASSISIGPAALRACQWRSQIQPRCPLHHTHAHLQLHPAAPPSTLANSFISLVSFGSDRFGLCGRLRHLMCQCVCVRVTALFWHESFKWIHVNFRLRVLAFSVCAQHQVSVEAGPECIVYPAVYMLLLLNLGWPILHFSLIFHLHFADLSVCWCVCSPFLSPCGQNHCGKTVTYDTCANQKKKSIYSKDP